MSNISRCPLWEYPNISSQKYSTSVPKIYSVEIRCIFGRNKVINIRYIHKNCSTSVLTILHAEIRRFL